MAERPVNTSVGLVTYEVLVDGTEIPGNMSPSSITITQEVNRVSNAKIVIPDGDAPEQSFPLSEGDFFVPGKEIQINLGYSTENTEVFKGIITGQSIKVGQGGASELVVKCYGKALKMTVGRKRKYFLDVKDSDLISTLIGDHGLNKDVTATSYQHKELIQYDTTDWDFLMMRAEANGLVVYDSGDKVFVKEPTVSGSSALSLTYGVDIFKVDLDMDARTQLPNTVKAGAWDMATQSWVESTASSPTEPGWGNITGKRLSEVVNPSEYEMVMTPPIETDMLKKWADARLLKSRLAKIRGKVSCRGVVGVTANTIVQLAGLGDRFNGEVWVSGVTHKVEKGEWIMDIKIGLSPNWFSETTPDIMMPPAGGLSAGVYGLQNAKVLKIHEDPNGDFRIQVDLPTITGSSDGVWARMAHLYASNSIGSFFLPEVGDEVVVGFLNNDPTYPVILGMLYHQQHATPFEPDDLNTYKGIVTRSKMKLTFEDEAVWAKLETPGGNSLLISDDEKQIKLEDQHGNTIVMNADGITMDTPGDFTVTAGGKISMEATGEVSAKSSGGDVKGEGLNVQFKAQVGFKAEGSATAELKASGQTTVKGAMVMIN